MCGLVGMAGDFMMKHRDMMKLLLFFDSLRGEDSTGVLSVRRNRDYELKKMTIPGYEFVNQPFIPNLLSLNDQIWLGHNRFKTVGSANRANAHPFDYIDDEGYCTLVGAHNGTLKNKYELEKLLESKATFGTDSETLFNLIGERGLKDAMKEAEGAWSLVYWDAQTNSINFLRNDERPMYYTFDKDRRCLMWASELWMLRVAAMRCGIELEQTQGKTDAIYSTMVDTHYQIEVPQNSRDSFGDFKREGDVQGKPERRFLQNVGFHGGYGQGNYRYTGQNKPAADEEFDDDINTLYSVVGGHESQAKKKGNEETKGANETRKAVVTLVDPNSDEDIAPVYGNSGKFLTQKERRSIIEKGCVWCGSKFGQSEPHLLDDESGVCIGCVNGGWDMIASRKMGSGFQDEVDKIIKAASEKSRQNKKKDPILQSKVEGH